MSLEQDRIKKALINLPSDSDRNEIKIFIEDFNRKSSSEQARLKGEWQQKNFSVGPTNSASCPCCGK